MPSTAIAVGDKVKLKGEQESAYRPQSLVNYLSDNGLDQTSAVFTVKDIFAGRKDTLVDLDELDTQGGYYLRRFELVADAQDADAPVAQDAEAPVVGPDVVSYSQAAVDELVRRARKDAVATILGKVDEALRSLLDS